jgi:hypothetical protein
MLQVYDTLLQHLHVFVAIYTVLIVTILSRRRAGCTGRKSIIASLFAVFASRAGGGIARSLAGSFVLHWSRQRQIAADQI